MTSKLLLGLERYLQGEGSAFSLLGNAKEVCTAEEARRVCLVIDHALSKVGPTFDWQLRSDLSRLVGLLQDAQGADAIDAFVQHGLPRLRKQIREGLAGAPDPADVRPLSLKILAMYGQVEDAPLLIQAAHAPALQDSYLWSVIFRCLENSELLGNSVFNGLRSPLPSGFAAVAYLDVANAAARAGSTGVHPFDCDDGAGLLAAWLSSRDQKTYSYAVSATAALPFVGPARREELLQSALAHPDVDVRMEAAWVQVRMGNDEGHAQLKTFARDPRYSRRAVRYLEELGAADSVPGEVRTEDFQALAEMCEWLAHPNEFGRPPDRIYQADSRELYWPPTEDQRRLRVFQYEYEGDDGKLDEGFGLTGSVTWSMGGEQLATEPEDVYCLHCAWELEMNGDPRAPDERTVEEGRRILREFNPRFGRPGLSAVQ